ncbi:hypothetical protein HDU97_002419 [Phlyctochytrium planicorne]|nr:hypothetical protein HDU97_002419 [Phlyctochytrium planicorne]
MLDPFQAPNEGDVHISPALLDPSSDHAKYTVMSYKFKPETIDYSKPGALYSNSKNNWTLDYANQDGQVQTFEAEQVPGKDIECLLFYDPETNTYTLEPLDSTIRTKPIRSGGKKGASNPSTHVSSTNSPIFDGGHELEDLDALKSSPEEYDQSNAAIDDDDDDLVKQLENELEAVDLDIPLALPASTVQSNSVEPDLDDDLFDDEIEAALEIDGAMESNTPAPHDDLIEELSLPPAKSNSAPPAAPTPKKFQPTSLTAKLEGESDSGSGSSSSGSDSDDSSSDSDSGSEAD